MKINKLHKADYPNLLKQISRLPETMDMAGALPSEDYKLLCVIGAREYSNYGKEVCKKLISGLKGYPIVIVSGLAVGIDSFAHEAALETDLKTIAFPGSGLSPASLYPSSRRKLAQKIVDSGGAILSPFNYEQPGTNWTFPERNRLMAAISHATLVIEGRKKSGTSITAKAANDFGRDVMAVPGSIFSELSNGTNNLIKEGAIPVTCSEDILEVLGFSRANITSPKRNYSEMNLSDLQIQIINRLINENLDFSQIIKNLPISPAELNIILSELELLDILKEQNGIYCLL